MMINNNYAELVSKARASGASIVNFEPSVQEVSPVPAIKGEKDTFTLSEQAKALMNGGVIEETAPTYVKPETANALLEKSQAANSVESSPIKDDRFAELMQNILDQRLGIDREKLEEINAMMKEIAENENMSPEEKEKALKQLEEIREKIIEESIEIREVAEKTFTQDENV